MKKDYKDTLLMPETDFNMRANLIEKEPKYRQEWLDKEIYKKALEANKNNEKFILHDGPPYANGDIHVGHALNKILKDIIVRYKTMSGFYTPYIPGWDTHGLPIENKMLEELGMTKDDLDQVTLREKASKYADKQVISQKKQFRSLSLFADLSDSYLTKNKDFEVGQLKLFKKMFLDGLVFKGMKPVYWSPSSQSALAEAEVEYEDVRSPQIIVAFDLINEDASLLIMTTTPWTLPANSGVAVGKDFDYALVKANKRKYYIALNLVQSVAELNNWDEHKVIKTIKGSELVGKEYISPINKIKAPVISGHHVTTDAGTGLVHMAPLFGEDDYLIGKEHELEMIMHVDGKGNFNKEAGKFNGLFYADANKAIGEELGDKLLSIKFIKHSYPHDWRTHKPVIYRGTPQWFVNIASLKNKIVSELKKVNSYPSWGTSRLSKMIQGREEWTISRQRTWGVPIIAFYNKEGEVITNEEMFDYVIDLVSKEGTDIWWKKTTDELLPKKYRDKGYTKEMDIMDVWFDSGSSHIWMEKIFGVDQADLYLEGSDQYRGWFNSSLINSIAYRGKSPYKNLVSHGFVLDGKNQKMSKSKGNVVDPLKIISKQGADILRLWAASSDYTSDITISDEILKQTSGLYRNFRTKLRFMLGNLNDFNNSKDRVDFTGYDLQIHNEVSILKMEYFNAMDNYDFSKAIKLLNNFIVDLSGFYLDYTKDFLYADKSNSSRRRMVQSNIYDIALFYIKALAPFIPTSMEDAYKSFGGSKESIHLELFNKNIERKIDKDSYKEFYELKDKIFKAIEVARNNEVIKRSFEAHIQIPKIYDFSEEELQKMFMIGKVTVGKDIKVFKWESHKCERCWNHFDKVNKDGICSRCEKVTK